jgi:hypothetical protein
LHLGASVRNTVAGNPTEPRQIISISNARRRYVARRSGALADVAERLKEGA